MLKTYLYIPEQLDDEIIHTAKALKQSKAATIRQALEKGIRDIQHRSAASTQILLKIAELGKKYKVNGPKDAIEHFDEYLYGKDWSKNE